MTKLFDKLVASIFIDSVFWHKYWHCHRMPSRSFRLNGRQFHICARCTGLAMGTMLAPIGILLNVEDIRHCMIIPLLLIADGATQAIGMRKSTNSIRFLTGIGTPASLAAIASHWA
jgi:uncharacterized membrane protein